MKTTVRTWLLSAAMLVTTGISGIASAEDKACIPAADMTEIAQHFTQFRQYSGREFCYDGSETSTLLESIMFMRNTAFSGAMPKSQDELFSGVFASDWWAYFIGRVGQFSIDRNCPKGVIAYVYAFGGDTMYVCSTALTGLFTSMDRASVFMHEARHLDGFPHMTCTHGPRKGLQGACDVRISDAGSYAVTVETYAQLAKYAIDIHPALQAYARSSAIVYADEAFEQEVQIDRQDQFLVMTKQKEFYKLSATSSDVERLGDAPTLGHIVMRAKYMVLIPDDRNEPAQLVFARNEGAPLNQAHDYAVEYNSQTPAQRADLVDFHLGAQWGARVYKNSLRLACDPRSASIQDLALTQTPVTLLYPNGVDRAARTVQMLTQDGSILDMGCDARGVGFVRASAFTMDQPFKRIYRSGQDVLGLSLDGHLFKVVGGVSTPYATQLDGQIHELVPMQTWAFFGL